METYTPIKDFEQTKGDISSAWLRSHKGMNHLIGFVSSRKEHGHVVVHSERKKNEKEAGFKIGSSDTLKVSAKIQEKYGGEIEPSGYGNNFKFDVCSIKNSTIQMTPEGIAKVARYIIKELGLEEDDFKIKPIFL